MNKLPDRNRWIGWVWLAWLVAILAVIGGIVAINLIGFIEVPKPNRFGRMETVQEPNIFIWSVAIGQAVSAAMLAAIFSMINSIYQNTCDQLSLAVTKPGIRSSLEQADEQPELDANALSGTTAGREGLKVLKVNRRSPLSGLLKPGHILLAINSSPVLTELNAENAVMKGKNIIEFLNSDGDKKAYSIRMEPGPLHIQFER